MGSALAWKLSSAVKQGCWAEPGRSVRAKKERVTTNAMYLRREPEPLPKRETTTTTILSAYSSGVVKFSTSSDAAQGPA